MSLFKNMFGKKNTAKSIESYEDFWNWFLQNEKDFFETVKTQKDIEKNFFDKLSSKLSELKDGFYFLTGMYDANTAELIFTPDGIVKNIVFAEELVKSAPTLEHWKFTALKPPVDINNLGINMAGYKFDNNNLSFYAVEHSHYPDEVDIVIVHNDYKEEDKAAITNGTIIFLDNYLGELNSVTTIDNLTVTGKDKAEKELIPIHKLKDYLIWREKEFVEKYSGMRRDTENDAYASLEAQLDNGMPLIAIVNSTLLEWDSKASHPWILRIEIQYKGNEHGMPDNKTYDLLNSFEDEMMLELKDSDGYLNIGRQTVDSMREIFFACKDFRKPAKVISSFQKKYADRLNIDYHIYKDKYWQSFERFRPGVE